MSDNDIVKFNMDELKKRVTDSVVANFGMLIPEEAFTAMVNKEVKAFFEETSMQVVIEQFRTGGYNSDTKDQLKLACTPFRLMVWNKMLEIGRAKINEVFNSEAFKAQIIYDHNYSPNTLNADLSTEMEDVLIKMIPQFMAAQMRGVFASMVVQAKEEVLKSIRPN